MSYLLVGYDMSYFSGKLRAYLRCKGLPFTEHGPSLRTSRRLVADRIGYFMLPVLITAEDETLSDTSFIIAELERRHPEPPMLPATPRQRLAAYLFELLGDEWMIPPAMHYRWQVGDANLRRFLDEAGGRLFPWMPRILSRRIANRVAAGRMRAHLPHLDLGPRMQPAWRAWTERLCDEFDAHFAAHPYLLGGAPCLGDFGLQGPFYAHLGADPWPKAHLMGPRRHFMRWVERVQFARGAADGAWLAGDTVPATLDPIIQRFAREFVPVLRQAAAHMNAWAAGNDIRERWVPRMLPECEYRLGETLSRRPIMSSHLWKAQRLLDHIDGLDEAGRRQTQDWLDRAGTSLEELTVPGRPRFERRGHRMYVSQAGGG